MNRSPYLLRSHAALRRSLLPVLAAFALGFPPACKAQPQAQLQAAALAGFRSYTQAVEARLELQHAKSPVLTEAEFSRLRQGSFLLEAVTAADAASLPGFPLSGAMLHHWRGTAFFAGGSASSFEHLLRDLGSYTRVFAPEVLHAQVLETTPTGMRAMLRVRQKHILTVTLDTTYDIRFERPDRLDPTHGASSSRSNQVREIADAGTPDEHALAPGQDHGFLWAQNTYWTWAERDGGLLVQVESVSLSRSIPPGLGWAVRPFTESVPRESLQFTLQHVRAALGR